MYMNLHRSVLRRLAAAALAGAPLMNDFAVLSLSDLMTERTLIEKRLRAAGGGRSVHLFGFVEQRAQCAAGIEAGVAGVGEVDKLRGGIGKNIG